MCNAAKTGCAGLRERLILQAKPRFAAMMGNVVQLTNAISLNIDTVAFAAAALLFIVLVLIGLPVGAVSG